MLESFIVAAMTKDEAPISSRFAGYSRTLLPQRRREQIGAFAFPRSAPHATVTRLHRRLGRKDRPIHHPMASRANCKRGIAKVCPASGETTGQTMNRLVMPRLGFPGIIGKSGSVLIRVSANHPWGSYV